MAKNVFLFQLLSIISAVSLLCLTTLVSCQYTGGSYGNSLQQQQRSNSFLGNPLSSIRSLFSLGSFGRPRFNSGYGGVNNRQGVYNQYGAYNPALYGNTAYTQQQRPPTYNSMFSG